jgi:hypothetical protein
MDYTSSAKHATVEIPLLFVWPTSFFYSTYVSVNIHRNSHPTISSSRVFHSPLRLSRLDVARDLSLAYALKLHRIVFPDFAVSDTALGQHCGIKTLMQE